MAETVDKSPSLGSVVKKMMAINPSLGADDLIGIVRRASERREGLKGVFVSSDIINEELALSMARQTLTKEVARESLE